MQANCFAKLQSGLAGARKPKTTHTQSQGRGRGEGFEGAPVTLVQESVNTSARAELRKEGRKRVKARIPNFTLDCHLARVWEGIEKLSNLGIFGIPQNHAPAKSHLLN